MVWQSVCRLVEVREEDGEERGCTEDFLNESAAFSLAKIAL